MKKFVLAAALVILLGSFNYALAKKVTNEITLNGTYSASLKMRITVQSLGAIVNGQTDGTVTFSPGTPTSTGTFEVSEGQTGTFLLNNKGNKATFSIDASTLTDFEDQVRVAIGDAEGVTIVEDDIDFINTKLSVTKGTISKKTLIPTNTITIKYSGKVIWKIGNDTHQKKFTVQAQMKVHPAT